VTTLFFLENKTGSMLSWQQYFSWKNIVALGVIPHFLRNGACELLGRCA